MDYVKNPREIENTSMDIIETHLPHLKKLPDGERAIIRRIVHTTGDIECAQLVRIHPLAVETGIAAIRAGRPVVTDVHMLQAGINGNKLKEFGMETFCYIRDPRVVEEAAITGETRAMAAMRLAKPQLDGGIVAIGNAPTALFLLCDMINKGEVHPALVVGTPVGFVGAAESKELLCEMPVPYVTINGTRGGSNIAASVINALLYTA